MNKDIILQNARKLIQMYKDGLLGGEIMPEDANPHLDKDSLENFLYFTLPMSLNYQRNSYILWQAALKTYNDPDTSFVFDPKKVIDAPFEKVQEALVKYKVALQKNKQTEIWITICNSIVNLFNGDIRKLFSQNNFDVDAIRDYMQNKHKRDFPYLSGIKLCNYYLYVIYQYTSFSYPNLEKLTVAPDTHVCKATYKLGLITQEELDSANVQMIVIKRWQELLKGTELMPIDVHTPLWLWSRNNFREII